jgi:hypothetical protein
LVTVIDYLRDRRYVPADSTESVRGCSRNPVE